ncbi:hypothetical protein N7453_004747 [Penicillium expansum]|nr:hypothetical protein N7453_004747 [Penicillium expansum]
MDISWTTIQGIIVAGDDDRFAPDSVQPAEKDLVLAAMKASIGSSGYSKDWAIHRWAAIGGTKYPRT